MSRIRRERLNRSLVSSMHIFLGEVVFFVGLVSISLYLVLIFVGPTVRSILDVNVRQSKWVLANFGFLSISGVLFQLGGIWKQFERFSFVFYSFATVTSAASFAIQLFKIIVQGFEWIGVEMFPNQPIAHDSMFIAIGGFLFGFTSLYFIYSSINLWFETRERL